MSENDKKYKNYENRKTKQKEGYQTKWGYQLITNPTKTCNYCKNKGHVINTCVRKHSSIRNVHQQNLIPINERKDSETEMPTLNLANPFEQDLNADRDANILPRVSSEDLQNLRNERETNQAEVIPTSVLMVNCVRVSPDSGGDTRRNRPSKKVDDDDFSLPSSDDSDVEDQLDFTAQSFENIGEVKSDEFQGDTEEHADNHDFHASFTDNNRNISANYSVQNQESYNTQHELTQNETDVATDVLKQMLNINSEKK